MFLNNVFHQDRELDIDDVREALVLCGKPQRPVNNFQTSSVTSRLTDVSKYGGTHRQRFDSSGNGLGMAGRRDIRDLPILWPEPTADGFLITCPSATGAGREGATSPNRPRNRRSASASFCPI